MVIKSIAKTTFNKHASLADYGCADGGTDLNLWCRVIAFLQTNDKTLQLLHFWCDQPQNDWNSLFGRINGTIKQPEGYTDDGPEYQQFMNVFPIASGTSFFEQVVPSDSLSFGFSSTAMVPNI
jgi:hypothetical protein